MLLTCAALASLPPGDWRKVEALSDEFDALNLTRWNTSVASWGNWSWAAANTKVSDGNLALTMSYDPHTRPHTGQTIYYRSGIAKSKPENAISFGYYEARIKGASRWPGVCPAFWAWRHTNEYWTELDFVEMEENLTDEKDIDFTAHVFPPSVPKHISNSTHKHFDFDPRDAFHVYGMEWNKTLLTWWVDDVLVKQIPASPHFDEGRPMDIAVSFGLRPPPRVTPDPTGFPTTFLTDYVRVYQRASDVRA